jgi:hypothetical protein
VSIPPNRTDNQKVFQARGCLGIAVGVGAGLFIFGLLVVVLAVVAYKSLTGPAAPPVMTPNASAGAATGTSPFDPVKGSGTPAPQTPSINPILAQITPAANTPQQDGVGIAILLDTTGSMNDRSVDGRDMQPKLTVAKRAVLALLDQADKAAKAAPNRNIRVALYEFSDRSFQDDCRRIIPLGPLNLPAARKAVNGLAASGGTPIGNAMILALKDLAASGLAHQHVLVVTDGENNQGYDPADVMNAAGQLPQESRPAVYFVAFDIAAQRFNGLRDAGALVLGASGGAELQQTLDYILTGKILAEQPAVPGSP